MSHQLDWWWLFRHCWGGIPGRLAHSSIISLKLRTLCSSLLSSLLILPPTCPPRPRPHPPDFHGANESFRPVIMALVHNSAHRQPVTSYFVKDMCVCVCVSDNDWSCHLFTPTTLLWVSFTCNYGFVLALAIPVLLSERPFRIWLLWSY